MLDFFGMLVSSAIVTGSVCLSKLTLNVSSEVKVIRGQEALLGCSFTPPQRADFVGDIRVSWSRHAAGGAFFQCQVNATAPAPSCLAVDGYSLAGDLRRGRSSLRIGKALDQGEYFCTVMVGREWAQDKLILRVQVKPSIVSLSLVAVGNQSRLQCIAEGDPLPNITWLLESGRPLAWTDAWTSPAGPDQLCSSVPYEGHGELTCLAESALGRVQRKHRLPEWRGADGRETAAVAAGVAVALVLLVVAVVVAYRLRIRGAERPVQISQRPPEGAAESQPIYTTVALPQIGEGVSNKRQDVLYSMVNLH
ncbi:sialic acid-binding Ig-like lectin 15 [Stigmatopora nigra]